MVTAVASTFLEDINITRQKWDLNVTDNNNTKMSLVLLTKITNLSKETKRWASAAAAQWNAEQSESTDSWTLGVYSATLPRDKSGQIEKSSFCPSLPLICCGPVTAELLNLWQWVAVLDSFIHTVIALNLWALLPAFCIHPPSVLIALSMLPITSNIAHVLSWSPSFKRYGKKFL